MEEKTLTLTRGVSVLPWELVIEILSWLPVKTLLRFRCVSKSWKSLISDDKSFTKLHLNRSLQNEHFLLKLELTNFIEDGVFPIPVSRLLNGPPSIDDDWFSRVRYNYSQIDDGCDRRFKSMYSDYCSRLKSDYSILKSDYSILGSYNGLVCLLGWYEFSYPTEQVWIRLWNPATRSMSRKSPICAVPYDSWKYYGFGYDHSRHAYKVVMVLWDCDEKKMETIVYCMGDACWRKVSSNHGFPLRLKAFEGQFVDGCMNWLALDKLNSHSHSWRDANVTLDHLDPLNDQIDYQNFFPTDEDLEDFFKELADTTGETPTNHTELEQDNIVVEQDGIESIDNQIDYESFSLTDEDLRDLFKDIPDIVEQNNNIEEPINDNINAWDDFVEDALPLPPAGKPNPIYLQHIWLKIDDVKVSICW
ncbi:F-box protein At1g52495-like isoform X2 [Lotus japonicus]|uniref:F-box protein At1g52495-like isoform X2 n=1 Tax=Lotus japonicus TaxID=34305 RepID=UPI00258BDD3C|nr:F-box protein At1g52495-like isoform X2 [Lotus japonicus]